MSRTWICDDRFDMDEDSFDGLLEKVLGFRSNTDEVSCWFCGFLPMEPISMGVCLDVGMIGLENGSVVFIEGGI